MSMLAIENLNVWFGGGRDRVDAVRQASFEVERGASFGLVGESGSGKSTVLRAIMGLAKDWSGSITVDGQPVNTPAEAIFRMSVAGIGHQAQVTRLRDGERTDLPVDMIAPPESPARGAITLSRRTVLAGTEVSNANPALIDELGLPIETLGVVISGAGPTAPRLGLQVGDILIAVNGREIRNPADVEDALRAAGRSGILEILRSGRQMAFRFRV